MTANNCAHKATCGDFASFGSFTCDTCKHNPRVIAIEAERFDSSRDTAGGLLALETENAQLKREVERLRGELSDSNLERDKGYEFLGMWQKWARGILISHGKCACGTIPDDTNARAIIKELTKRTGDAVALTRARDRYARFNKSNRSQYLELRETKNSIWQALRNVKREAWATIVQQRAELSTLRESEAKAWGLVGELVIGSNGPIDRVEFTQSLRNASAALAARKAGQ